MPRKNTKIMRRRVRFGFIHADDVTFEGALDAIGQEIAGSAGGFVVTPNVDHVCLAETDEALRAAYQDAALSLADGMPLLWLARAMGCALPAKISGSDLVGPLMERAADRKWRVYLLGGAAGIGDAAATALRARYPALQIVGVDAPPVNFEKNQKQNAAVIAKIQEAKPNLLLVALGCPKQEIWMHTHAAALAPAVAVGVGATLDFIAGKVRRAPPWMSRLGLEWLFRLAQEPGRMAQRYLVRDRAILGIALRMFLLPAKQRTFMA